MAAPAPDRIANPAAPSPLIYLESEKAA
jgi:hypothetical protein